MLGSRGRGSFRLGVESLPFLFDLGVVVLVVVVERCWDWRMVGDRPSEIGI